MKLFWKIVNKKCGFLNAISGQLYMKVRIKACFALFFYCCLIHFLILEQIEYLFLKIWWQAF